MTDRFIRPSTAKEMEELKLSLKKFIAKQKVKFGTTGPGQQLNSETPAPSSSLSKSGNSSSKDVCVPSKRKELSSEAKAAANAALARIEGRDKKELNTSLAAIQALVRRELEVERKVKKEHGNSRDWGQHERFVGK
ncbi:hypothetical protein pipiens_011449 [Culex pipiens pipiens]|uniref:Uncharacterized protein n=1 Tax=Culex pipiens pipiens TaxID=38569 RepID=A0ABD1D6A1_CULPP